MIDDGAQIAIGARTGRRFEHEPRQTSIDQIIFERRIVLQIDFGTATRDLVERRLGNEEVPVFDQLGHLPVEEGQQQRADMRAIDIGISHDHDLVIAQFFELELVTPDAGAERLNHRPDFAAAEHPVEPRTLDIQDLAAQWQDRLELAVAALLGTAAGAVTFDQKQLGLRRIALLAVRQLAGQACNIERTLAACQVARLFGGFASGGGIDDLRHDGARMGRIFLQPDGEAIGDQRFQRLPHFRRNQLVLGL